MGLALIVAFGSEWTEDRSPLGGTGGGIVAVDFRDAVLLVAVAVDALDTTEDRADDVDNDRLGAEGDSF